MKQSPSVTKLLNKVWEIFRALENIDKELKRKNQAAFSVTFYHRDKVLVFTGWSDRFPQYPSDNRWTESYQYEITSRGISFISYQKKESTEEPWHSVGWSTSGAENEMKLIQVPNDPPPGYKGTMYLYHQEKIKETLAALPAWAMVVSVE